MAFCTKCGALLREEDNFCTNCGAAVFVAQGTQKPAQMRQAPPLRVVSSLYDPTPRPLPTFWGAVKNCLAKFSSYRGRASRREFWYFHLFYLALFFAFVASIVIAVQDDLGLAQPAGLLLAVLFGISLLLFLLPLIAVSARRMHDVGIDHPFFYLVLLGCSPAFFFFGCLKSEPRANEYGPQPGAGVEPTPEPTDDATFAADDSGGDLG